MNKKLRLQIINALLINETIDIVVKEHPESEFDITKILGKAIIQTVEKHPAFFKIECPICHSVLHKTNNTPDYWMCIKCVKGFNIEELVKLKGLLE